MSANTIQNKDLASLVSRAPTGVMSAITKASAKAGVNFAYMVQQAAAESGFDEDAKAGSSSASGLYQFIDKTWLSMVKKYGADYGMGAQAAQINDQCKVSDPCARKAILALRNDPEKASAMAAEFARENQQSLEQNWGGKVGPTELYFAHFMGAGSASAFMKARDADPTQSAATIFPAAAKANRAVFYDTKTGRPKTMDEVYAFFDKKFSVKTADTPSLDVQTGDNQIAQAEPASSAKIISPVFTSGLSSLSSSSALAANDAPSQPFGVRHYNSLMPAQNLVSSPVDIMFMSQMGLPTVDRPGALNKS